MNQNQTFTTTLTSKGQLTVPKRVRNRLALGAGTKLDISLQGHGFLTQPQKKPRLLDLAGSLKHLDDGRTTKEIIAEAHRLASLEIIKRGKLNKKSQ